MKLKPYAETLPLRLRQILSDLGLLVWVVAWGLVGRALFRTVDGLRAATTSAEDAGAGFAGRLDDVAGGVARLPIVGRELRRPFLGAADAGRALESAGAAAGETVHAIALWSGFLVAAIPILWLVARHVPGRLRWMREAGAAARLRLDAADLHLFALRAAATAPLHRLQRVCADPATALAQGEYAALAAIELERLGLRLPASE